MERVVPKYYSVHYEMLLWEPIELSRLIPGNELNADIRAYMNHFDVLRHCETDNDQKNVFKQCYWIMRRAFSAGGRIEHLMVVDDTHSSRYVLSFDIVFDNIMQLSDF